jgi:NADH-quinone oxidoreductase subunit N
MPTALLALNLLELLHTVWGRFSYLSSAPAQKLGEWAWQETAYYLLSPEIALLIGVIIIALIEIFTKRDNYLLAIWISLAALLVNFALTVHMMYYTSRFFNYGLGLWWGGLETIDPYALFFKQLMDWGDIILILALFRYRLLKQYRVEFLILVLCGTIAFDLMVGSSDLLAVYVMTEFGGICAYILAAYYKHDLRSLESGLKYFITGATSTTALLFAMSLLYGTCGSTNFYEIQSIAQGGGASIPAVVFSIVLFMVALGYKIGIAPFHLWIADVYEGAPTPVTAYISVFPKTAGMGVLLRLLFVPFGALKTVWMPILIVMAIASMVIGNVMAMRQTSFKRMMGFSGVAHVGYMLIGIIAAANQTGGETDALGFFAVMYYVLAYFFMNLGIFIVALVVEHQGGNDHLDSYNGLVRRNPFMAVLVTILLLALVGLPPTTGFWAKFFLFYSLSFYYHLNPWNLLLIVFAVLTTVIGAYYYFMLAYRIWILPPAPEHAGRFQPVLFERTAVLIPALFTLLLGVVFIAVPFDYVRGAYFLMSKAMTGI